MVLMDVVLEAALLVVLLEEESPMEDRSETD